jgi:hypothetical protein
MPQSIIWIIFKSHPCSRVPFGMFFAKALFGIGSKSQFLAFPQLDNEDVCRERCTSVMGQERPISDLESCLKTTHMWKTGLEPESYKKPRQHKKPCLVSAPMAHTAMVRKMPALSLQSLTVLLHVVIRVIISVP